MKYSLFVLLFVYLTHWQAVIALFTGAFTSPTKSVPYKDKRLVKLLKEKTGIEFRFKKAISDKYTGFTLIFPPNTIVLSSKVIENFDKNEMEWIGLHEAGHRVYLHGYKYIFVALMFISTGFFVLHKYSIINPIVLALLLCPIQQQVNRFFETQADRYAVENMNNPEGMITANQKFKKATRSRVYKSDILRTLFTPHLSYEQRMIMAGKEIEKRRSR